MKKHLHIQIQKHTSKLLLISSIFSILGAGLIMFDTSTSTETFAQSVQATGCYNLEGWPTNFTANGEFVMGRSSPKETYDKTCNELSRKLICTEGKWSLDANVWKYPSCTDQVPDRKDCSTPITGKHLESKLLYKKAIAEPTETCMGFNFRCIDGQWSGTDNQNLTQSSYPEASCKESTPGQCIARGKTYLGSLESINVYSATTSNTTKKCDDLKTKITCINQVRSGITPTLPNTNTAGRATLYTGCTDLNILSCTFTGGNNQLQTLGHNQSEIGFLSSIVPFGQTCMTGIIKCDNGILGGDSCAIHKSCAPAIGRNCTFTGANGPFTLLNGTSTGVYSTDSVGFGETCFSGTVKCIDGVLGGEVNYKYPTCTPKSSSSCTLPRGQTILNSGTEVGYSTILRETTGQIYPASCESYSGTLTCKNGSIFGGEEKYKYSKSQCETPQAKTCTLPRGDLWQHTRTGFGYSQKNATYPKSCEDYSTLFTCTNGLLNGGNSRTYQYSGCTPIGRPKTGVDLALFVDNLPSKTLTITGVPILGTIKLKTANLQVAQYSSPLIKIAIENVGANALSGTAIPAGFLQCERKISNKPGDVITIYKSKPLTQFVANSMIPQMLSITIKDIFTQGIGDKFVTCWLNKDKTYFADETYMENNIWTGIIQVIEADRFDLAMNRAIEPIAENLETPELNSALGGADTIKNFVFKKVMDVLVPLIVLIGILSSILGFYKMFFSSEDAAMKERIQYITYGIIGIIVIMSAKFIGNTMYTLLDTGVGGELSGKAMAIGVYDQIVYPFVKLGMYLVLGVMFIILVSRVITFIFGTSDDAQKKAGTIIGRNIIAMIIIIGAKQIVEVIYGKSADIRAQEISNLGQIGSGILADKNIPILYTIINRAMGLTSLIVLLIIVFQSFKLLMKPDSADQMKSIKNSLLYIFIGLMIIGTGYLITNFLIIS